MNEGSNGLLISSNIIESASSGTRIDVIHLLERQKLQPPANAYLIEENRYGIAYATKRQFPYLITYGLFDCRAIGFYKPTEKKGLLAHLSVTRDLSEAIERIIEEFGGDISDSDAFLISGRNELLIDTVVTDNEGFVYPAYSRISKELLKHRPRRLLLDSDSYVRNRSIALDLRTGQLSEIDMTQKWEWEKNDRSLNKKLEINLAE